MHSVFLSVCEGGGFALAAGCLVGAISRVRLIGAITAGVLGAAVFALALSAGDHATWPGIVAGAILGILADSVAAGIAGGATRRAGERARSTVTAFVVAFAVVLAALSALIPPISIAALVTIAFFALARRRRARQKYAGLRILR